MKFRSAGLLASLVLAALTACSPMTNSQPFENGIIIRTTENFQHPADVGAFVEMAARHDISTISLLVKQDEDSFTASGQVFYRSRIAPIAPGYRRFDVLQAVLKEAHARGIRVLAWIPQFHDQAAAAAHPEWRMMSLQGGQVAPFTGSGQTEHFVNPLDPDVQDYELSIIQEVAGLGVDGIMLDWIRFDDYNMDLGPAARLQYQDLTGIDPLTIDFKTPGPALDQWNDFRTAAIAGYVRKVRSSLPAGMPLGIYILPPEFLEVGQDAGRFNTQVDLLAPMCYFNDWGFPLDWFWTNCLADSAQKAGPADLVPVMDSNLEDEEYRQIFDHIRSGFPQVTSLAWFHHGRWTEDMLERIQGLR